MGGQIQNTFALFHSDLSHTFPLIPPGFLHWTVDIWRMYILMLLSQNRYVTRRLFDECSRNNTMDLFKCLHYSLDMFSSGCMVGHLVHNKHTDWEQSRGSHPSAVGRSWPCCSIKIYCQELNFVNCVHNMFIICVHNMHPYDIITLCTQFPNILKWFHNNNIFSIS